MDYLCLQMLGVEVELLKCHVCYNFFFPGIFFLEKVQKEEEKQQTTNDRKGI